MNHFAIFTKYWEPGTVKTRLSASIGDFMAASCCRFFVEVLVDRFSTEGDQRTIVFTPLGAEANFRKICREQWQLEAQVGGDLGERLKNFFDRAFVQGAVRVVVIGSDSPTLPKALVEQAWQQLNEAQPVVLGPTEDGGYYLIGAYRSTPPVFENIDWSTPNVWNQSIQRLQELGVRFSTLMRWYDVDDINDWDRLLQEIEDTTKQSPALDHVRTVFKRFCRSNSFLDGPVRPAWKPRKH